MEWAVEVYKPILDYAAAKGIVLGLEDDDDLTRTSVQSRLVIVKRVNHPAARIALDCGSFRKDGYKECEICVLYVSSTHVKTADVHAGRPTGAGGLGETIRHPRERRGIAGTFRLNYQRRTIRCRGNAAELIRCARIYSGA